MIRRNVLIFHSGALGDFVMTWPLALSAGRIFPQSRVIYVTASQKGALAEKLLRVESIDGESGWHGLFSEEATLGEKQAQLLAGAHAIVSFIARDGDVWSRNVRRIAPQAELLLINTKPPDSYPAHVTEYLIEQLKPSPLLRAATTAMTSFARNNGIGSRSPSPDAPVVIHPGSGAARKCWPIERFLELAGALRESGRKVKVVLGEVERENWAGEQIQRVRAAADVVEPKTYLELHEHISRGGVFIGNDTGPTHLAAITGTQTIALFGGDSTRWSPIGPRVRIIREKTIESISIAQVMSQLPARNRSQ